MEWVAWASHKYIMHGFGWGWHRDHHEPHDKVLEKNDLFALVGAAMSISMFALGSPLGVRRGCMVAGDLDRARHPRLRDCLHAGA